MKKIKQSFVEIVEGQPRKEHYINVSIVIGIACIIVAVILHFVKTDIK